MMNRLLLLAVVVFSLSGCARPHLTTIAAYQDPVLSPETGRVIFKKSNNVGEDGIDGAELVMAILSSQSADQNITYRLYEMVGDTFKPISSFFMHPKQPSFFLDLPTGKHRFVVARTRTDFFITHLIGEMATIDVNVEPGGTHSVIFGVGEIFGSTLYPEILMLDYQLNQKDLDFCYKLRYQKISGNERKKQMEIYATKYFPNKKGNYAFMLAARSVLFMQPAVTPDQKFITWTNKKTDGLKTDLAMLSPEKFKEKPFDIYKYVDL